jgi:phosphoserine phosphatase
MTAHLVITPGITQDCSPCPLERSIISALEGLLGTTGIALRGGGHRFEAIEAAQESQTIEVVRLAQEFRFDWAWIAHGQQLRDFRVLAMDMDSTIINIECLDELADFCGQKAAVAAITGAAMRGEITDYAESLRQRVALLKGLSITAVDRVIQERLRFNPGAADLISAAAAAGLRTLLVSGGFSLFTDHVSRSLGIHEVCSNRLEVESGRLTGRLMEPIVDGQAKKAAVLGLCERLGCDASAAIAVGDGANDLPMMAVAGLSVAYRAKPAVAAMASRAIEYGGLDSLLLGWNEPVDPAVNEEMLA